MKNTTQDEKAPKEALKVKTNLKAGHLTLRVIDLGLITKHGVVAVGPS